MAEIIFTSDAGQSLRGLLEARPHAGLFILYAEGIGEKLLGSLNVPDIIDSAVLIPVPQGEEHKSLATAEGIWQQMLDNGAMRNSLIVNIGGGMTTDLGGFAAACYMRSVPYINIPTTLLADVDASTGGKTGVNFGGVKNIIGAFHAPEATIISPQFLGTLPEEEILSGWAEMLKHALLTDGKTLASYLQTDPLRLHGEAWLPLIRESVAFKRGVTHADPRESGLRKCLNLGHTVGHAVEAIFAPVYGLRHGHAVAFGLVTALVLSRLRLDFPSAQLHQFASAVKELYPVVPLNCDQYEKVLALMHHDKKNRGDGLIHFVLLQAPGTPELNVPASDEEIKTALDITRDLLH